MEKRTPTDNHKAALKAAKAGRAVFPLQPLGKVPLFRNAHDTREAQRACQGKCGAVGHGLYDATKDAKRISGWWDLNPGANVAIRTGAPSGVVVLDVDPAKGGAESLAKLRQEFPDLPAKPTVITGNGGEHYYFAHPGHPVPNSAGQLAPGLDVRGDGGYVVIPPSTHPNSTRYRASGGKLGTLPVGLAQRMAKPPEPAKDRANGAPARDWRIVIADGIKRGRRDETFFQFAAYLRRLDVPVEVARLTLQGMWARAEQAPGDQFALADAVAKVDHVYSTYQPGAPELVTDDDTWNEDTSTLEFMTVAELLDKPRTRGWHAHGLMAHPTFGFIAGELKTLKTTMVAFAALALASGKPVFNQFPVEKPLRVLVLVGENDEPSYATELERIGKWMGLTPADIAKLPLALTFETADVDTARFQLSIDHALRKYRPDVVFLDPLYAYHGDEEVEITNLYSRAPVLRQFYEPCKAHGVSLWLVDHFNQTGSGLHLKRITQAGAGEVADSWWLLRHRQAPDLHNGDHWLQMDVGSRKWGGWSWDLDVNLGVFNEDTFMREGDVRLAVRKHKDDGKGEENKTMRRIREALEDVEEFTLTRQQVKNVVRGNADAFEKAWDRMCGAGRLEMKKAARKEGGGSRTRELWRYLPALEPW
jgi:hypothetical protein